MKTTSIKKALVISSAFMCTIGFTAMAQTPAKNDFKNMRAYGRTGINVFEAPKDTATTFDGISVKFGAGFTQTFQALDHSNGVTANIDSTTGKNINGLYGLTPGFNTAQANLFMDVQLADGIRMNVTSYLSARHHSETWVKGGYIQFDKLPFKSRFFDNVMKYTTIKMGHMEINYGDNHFRRSDGGHTFYNPFCENYIIDAFTTEIAGEVYGHYKGFIAMVAVSNGEIKGSVDQLYPTTNDPKAKRSPAIYGKLAFDKTFDNSFRVRAAASTYFNSSSQNNTLMWGDRTGSNYFMVMERQYPTGSLTSSASYSSQAWSGRVNPRFSDRISAQQFNLLVKFKGAELFGTYDMMSGRTNSEATDRSISQYGIDAIYRIGKLERIFVAARYNSATGNIAPNEQANKVTINRTAFAAGWMLTDNVLLKGEYVMQEYKDFNETMTTGAIDARYNGKFNGFVIQATVGF